ncbi:MAG: 4Fe-4S binding protein [Elainellaceae cyanobacterium]
MPYTITNQCIQCDRCLSSCPTQAIQDDGQQYWIDASQCTNCEGTYSVPQCWAVCPTNGGCVFSTSEIAAPSGDYWDSWFNIYDRLIAQLKSSHSTLSQQPNYWQSWFDSYAATLSRLQTQHL